MQNSPTVKDDLGRYIDAGYPILYIHTFDESKADEYIVSVAGKRDIFEWNNSNGFVDLRTKCRIDDWELENTLAYLKNGKELNRRLLVIKDADEMLRQDSQIRSDKAIALLKEIAGRIRMGLDATVIIVSSSLHIPKPLEKFITILELDMPSEEEIHHIIINFINDNDIPAIRAELLDELSAAFKGLSEFEINDLLRLAVSQGEGELTGKALQLIFTQKQQMILKAGILEMIPLKENISDIGGLENLKEWLVKKAKVFKDIKNAMEFGVPMPKGVLIAGVAGCGKSLSAKAAGKLFDVPLLKLDMGRLMGKYVGESEENMRRAIQLAEAISPCVLWVDELEKAFAGIGSGSGSEVITRLFGAFLTWMQEKTSATFVVATANDITKLPPELMRKGRFDEIFYVGLPEKEERKKIFEIHLKKRRRSDLGNIDLERVSEETKGYSGADIESVVGESIENVFVKGTGSLTTEDILDCIHSTHPLGEIMKEAIQDMSRLYEDRKFKKASK